jgi:Cys-tRNA(Pro)/Cys-tRNA(Cys) deacylase
VEVAAAIGMPAEQVYKTLVVLADDPKRKPMLVVVPAPATLELRTLAKQVGAKKVRMAPHAEAEALTGLQTGGISALALINKGFDVWLDSRARALATFAVSAAERGANVELPVADFVTLTRARWVELPAEDDASRAGAMEAGDAPGEPSNA